MKKRITNIITVITLTTFFSFLTMCQKVEKPLDGSESVQNTESSGELMKRSEINPKYTWDLTHIYASEDEWKKDYDRVEKKVNKIKSFEGKLGSSAKTLLDAFEFSDIIWAEYNKLYQYSSLAKDLDMSVSKYQAMFERVQVLGNKLSSEFAYFRPEILSIPNAKIEQFINSDAGLKVYKHKLDNLLRLKAHTLSKNEESLLALAGPIDAAFATTYKLFANADITFPIVKDETGNDVQISPARYYAGMASTDRDYRIRVYKGLYVPFINFKNTLSSLYYGSIKSNVFQAKARKYETTLKWSLDQFNIPTDVYKNLVNSINDNIEPLQRWGKLKKKVLGLKELHAYDTYVTLFPAVKKKYSYDAGVELVLKALEPLGDDYITKLKEVFDSRLIDVYETKGKRSGAYSSGSSKLTKPYILLNWGGELDDVFVLAHELGHNLHSLYTSIEQPPPYADYPIFLAEVASITNEMLLLDYMIENSESKEEKLSLIEKYLNNMKGTFYRQTRFAEFEMVVQEMVENGEVLTPDVLCKIFGDMYQKYWGEEMVVDVEETYSWSRIHHFYYDYYVYSYATSFAAAQLIAEHIKKDGQHAIEKHLNFLKSGDSKYAIPTLLENDVDMTTASPIVAVAKKMTELLDEMENLINEE